MPPPDGPGGQGADTSPWSGRFVGRAIPRLDDPRILTGRGSYLDDVRLPGMLHAAFLRSPHAHARLTGVKVGPALEVAGVRAAFHGGSAKLARLPGIRPDISTPNTVCPTRPLLARDVVRFVGEAVAVVVATSRYAAEDALDAVDVGYQPLPAVVDAEAALRPGAVQIHPDVPGNRYLQRTLERGAVDRAFAAADVVVDWRRFESPRYSGVPMETRGAMAVPEADGRVVLWTSTQVPHRVREVAAAILGLALDRVRVVTPDVGGGFGVKAQVYPEEVIVAWLARQLGAPVKWVEDRREHLLAAGHAREQVVRARLAATRDGRVTAIDAEITCDVGAYGVHPFGPALEPLGTSAMIPGPYRLPAYRYQVAAAATNKSPGGPYRGVGLPVSTLVHERLMDLLARRVALSSEEVRRRNLVPASEFPYTSITGMRYESGSYVECLERAVHALDVASWRSRQRQRRAAGEDVRLGIGIASYVEYTGMGSGTFQARGMLSVPGTDAVRLRVEVDGTITLTSSLSEMGQGIQTTLRQLAADGLGVPLETIRFTNTDTDVAPAGTGTFASRSAVLGAGALRSACRLLRERILAAAAEALEVDAADLELVETRVRVRGAPERGIGLGTLAARAGTRLDVSEAYDPPPATFPNATHAAVVEVDTRTGQSRFLAYVVAEDCGRIINPLVVEGQIHGAVAQGIGGGLLEELRYDPSGQLANASLMDYLVPTASDIPRLELLHLETPTPLVPGGFKGVGEGGTLAPPALIANALSDAIDAEVNALPATPERVLKLWKGRHEATAL